MIFRLVSSKYSFNSEYFKSWQYVTLVLLKLSGGYVHFETVIELPKWSEVSMVGLTPHMCATGWLEKTHQMERSTFEALEVQQKIYLKSQAVASL